MHHLPLFNKILEKVPNRTGGEPHPTPFCVLHFLLSVASLHTFPFFFLCCQSTAFRSPERLPVRFSGGSCAPCPCPKALSDVISDLGSWCWLCVPLSSSTRTSFRAIFRPSTHTHSLLPATVHTCLPSHDSLNNDSQGWLHFPIYVCYPCAEAIVIFSRPFSVVHRYLVRRTNACAFFLCAKICGCLSPGEYRLFYASRHAPVLPSLAASRERASAREKRPKLESDEELRSSIPPN